MLLSIAVVARRRLVVLQSSEVIKLGGTGGEKKTLSILVYKSIRLPKRR